MKVVDNLAFNRGLSHTLVEVGIPNICISIQTNYELIQKAHDSIHEFMYLAPLSLPTQTEVSWHPKSAFLTYQWEAFHQAHRSFLEALSGYYNVSYILLRSTLELLLKGALWEGLAHKEFRENAEVLNKDMKGKDLIMNRINYAFELKPSIREELEENSSGIFDIVTPIFDIPEIERKSIPRMPVIIKQLNSWCILTPILNPEKVIYDIYRELCKDVHVIPDKTDFGRRLLSEKDFLEIEIIPNELSKYIEILHKIMDIGIVIELNILRDWIDSGGNIELKKRLKTLENLGLEYSLKKLKSLMA